MKQSIRNNCFETNSSSYHTLTIKSAIPVKDFKVGEDVVVDPVIYPKKIGWSESYNYVARGSYEKAQLLLRFMGYEVEHQLDDLVEKSEYLNVDGHWDHDRRNVLMQERFNDTPLIKAFMSAIKKFIGENCSIQVKFTESWPPFYPAISDEAKSFNDLIGVAEEDLHDVNILTDKFYNILFNPEIEMLEECESND